MFHTSGALQSFRYAQSPQRARRTSLASPLSLASSGGPSAYASSRARITLRHFREPLDAKAVTPRSMNPYSALLCDSMFKSPATTGIERLPYGTLEQVIPDSGVINFRATALGRCVRKARRFGKPGMGCGSLSQGFCPAERRAEQASNGNHFSRLSRSSGARESQSAATRPLAVPSAPSLGAAVFLPRHLGPSLSPAFMRRAGEGVIRNTNKNVRETR